MASVHPWQRLVASLILLPNLGCIAESEGGGHGSSGAEESTGAQLDPLPPFEPEPCATNDAVVDRFCWRGCPADTDPVTFTHDVSCGATAISSGGAGESTASDVPTCLPGGVLPPGAATCFTVLTEGDRSAECEAEGWPVEIQIVGAASASACRIEAECQPSPSESIDCPALPVQCGDGWCAAQERCTDCPNDCGECGQYSACSDGSACDEPTPFCAAIEKLDGAGLCTTPCTEDDDCPGAAEGSAQCLDGACVVGCMDDGDCPSGSSCRDLGPVEPGVLVFLVCGP